MNIEKDTLSNIISAALHSGAKFSAKERDAIASLQDLCDKSEGSMVLEDLAQKKSYVLWDGTEDIRNLIESGCFEDDVGHLSENELEALLKEVEADIDWDDVASVSLSAGNGMILDVLTEKMGTD